MIDIPNTPHGFDDPANDNSTKFTRSRRKEWLKAWREQNTKPVPILYTQDELDRIEERSE